MQNTSMHELLCCNVQGLNVALDVAWVKELIQTPKVFPLPLMPSFVMGVFELRSNPMVLIHLAQYLHGEAEVISLEENRHAGVLILQEPLVEHAALDGVQTQERWRTPFAVWVNRIHEIATVSAESLIPTAQFGHAVPDRFLHSIVHWREQEWFNLQMHEVFNTRTIAQSIGAHAHSTLQKKLK